MAKFNWDSANKAKKGFEQGFEQIEDPDVQKYYDELDTSGKDPRFIPLGKLKDRGEPHHLISAPKTLSGDMKVELQKSLITSLMRLQLLSCVFLETK